MTLREASEQLYNAIKLHEGDTLPFALLEEGARNLFVQGGNDALLQCLKRLNKQESDAVITWLQTSDQESLNASLRKIAGGALRAGRVDRSLAAKCIELAPSNAVRQAFLPESMAKRLNIQEATKRREAAAKKGRSAEYRDGEIQGSISVPGGWDALREALE